MTLSDWTSSPRCMKFFIMIYGYPLTTATFFEFQELNITLS